VVLVLAVVVPATAAWVAWTADRLDRMHHRIERGRGTFETQLLRRAAVTLELAASDALDPAGRLLLMDAAHHARSAPPEDGAAESALSEALRTVLGGPEEIQALRAEPEVAPLVEELAAACAKVELARRFHNNDVVSARELRSRRRVRWLHLAGHVGEVCTVDLDDTPPAALVAA
jgi:hypothetical protein